MSGLNGTGSDAAWRERIAASSRRRKRKAVGVTAALVTAVGGLGGGAKALVDHAEHRAEVVAVAKLEERTEQHDRELVEVRDALREVHEDHMRMARIFGERLAGIEARLPMVPPADPKHREP